jgi:protein disulfide-isomerase
MPVSSLAAADWLTDLPKAQAQARTENKAVLVDFTGSDWCGWCIRLKKEVFSAPDFATYAEKNLVLVEIDFPKHKAQSPALKGANEALSAKYHIEGFPTVVVLNPQGGELGRLGYDPGGPKAFIRQLAQLTGRQSDPAPVAALKKAEGTIRNVAAKRDEAMPTDEKPLFNGAPPAPPPHFTELVLKGISGPKTRRLAMINNQTFAAGESVPVKLGNKQVKVHCLEVRESSVLVSVEGEAAPREIKLRQGL